MTNNYERYYIEEKIPLFQEISKWKWWLYSKKKIWRIWQYYGNKTNEMINMKWRRKLWNMEMKRIYNVIYYIWNNVMIIEENEEKW